ncbi:hypothetical protein [Henriciella algicola]|uniref:hypothetical protein n=1 Tax=Henriciella algicola TaxID=1608422 RepID=UPI0011C3C6DB|nr:hypothetical protein [Henriciella algicola]
MIMTLAVFVAPMSSAADVQHAFDEAAAECVDTHSEQTEPDEKPAKDAHDHVAHHCGSCHVHMIGSNNFGPGLQYAISGNWRSSDFLPPVSLHPDGLYRPPRV